MSTCCYRAATASATTNGGCPPEGTRSRGDRHAALEARGSPAATAVRGARRGPGRPRGAERLDGPLDGGGACGAGERSNRARQDRSGGRLGRRLGRRVDGVGVTGRVRSGRGPVVAIGAERAGGEPGGARGQRPAPTAVTVLGRGAMGPRRLRGHGAGGTRRPARTGAAGSRRRPRD